METIIIEITLGALDEAASFILPAHVPVRMLLGEIIRQVGLVYWNAEYDAQAMLLDKESCQPLHPQLTLAQNGVREGSKLILI